MARSLCQKQSEAFKLRARSALHCSFLSGLEQLAHTTPSCPLLLTWLPTDMETPSRFVCLLLDLTCPLHLRDRFHLRRAETSFGRKESFKRTCVHVYARVQSSMCFEVFGFARLPSHPAYVAKSKPAFLLSSRLDVPCAPLRSSSSSQCFRRNSPD